jgi:DNA-binding XRE family transcriptional regulator
MTDTYLMTGAQSRMARSLLKWSRETLAKEANVSRGTIRIFEDDQPIRDSIVLDIQSVFEAHGVECAPDGGVRPREDGIKDFRGYGGCDRFFANIAKMLEGKNTGIVCSIASQNMLSKSTGRNGRSNFERLQELSKVTSVRCLLEDKNIYLPGTPSFEVRVYPEVPTSLNPSEFAYGEEVTFAIEQDTRLHFRQPHQQQKCQIHNASIFQG